MPLLLHHNSLMTTRALPPKISRPYVLSPQILQRARRGSPFTELASLGHNFSSAGVDASSTQHTQLQLFAEKPSAGCAHEFKSTFQSLFNSNFQTKCSIQDTLGCCWLSLGNDFREPVSKTWAMPTTWMGAVNIILASFLQISVSYSKVPLLSRNVYSFPSWTGSELLTYIDFYSSVRFFRQSPWYLPAQKICLQLKCDSVLSLPKFVCSQLAKIRELNSTKWKCNVYQKDLKEFKILMSLKLSYLAVQQSALGELKDHLGT